MLRRAADIHQRVRALESRRIKLAEEYAEGDQKLADELDQLQAECSHAVIERYDQIHNGFPNKECLVCGALR